MRLRASFTVENSFIIPFFTMIIVVMVILALDMHDELIGKAVSFQGNMKIEQEKLEGSNRNQCVSDVSSYASLKSMKKLWIRTKWLIIAQESLSEKQGLH